MKTKIKNRLKELSTKQLIEVFEKLTNKTEEELIIRDFIMTELEERDEEAFDNWLDDEEGNSLKVYYKVS